MKNEERTAESGTTKRHGVAAIVFFFQNLAKMLAAIDLAMGHGSATDRATPLLERFGRGLLE